MRKSSTREDQTREDQQSLLATALSIAAEINECCDSIEDAKEVFAKLDEILKVRFGSEYRVSLEASHK